jgi:hypothetical protein
VKTRGVLARITGAVALFTVFIALTTNALGAPGARLGTNALGAPGARLATATAPPAAGGWGIFPNHSQPGPSINDFKGSFKVAGSDVTDLHGVTQHAVNSGCVAGETVTMVGKVAIDHEVIAAIGVDYFEVGGGPNSFARVKLTFQGRSSKKHHAKTHHGSGHLRIFFPGGSDTAQGFTGYSNLTYSSNAGGICNLEFSIAQG